MTDSQVANRQFSQEQLGRLHGITQQVGKICRSQLRTYLDALAPLFRPRRLLGNHMEGAGKESVANADQNFNEFREIYFKACSRPFDLRKELSTPLESVPTQIQLHEWEYHYEVQTERERRNINITSPLTWVLAYPSAYSHNMARQLIAAGQERDQESVRTFVLRTSLMYLMFTRLPDLTTVLEGLRYKVEIRKSHQLGDLPLVTVSAPVATVLPTDDLLLLAAAFSGRSGFVEVIDPERATRIPDPLQDQITKILESAHDSYPQN
ncbi:MAG TPA: hypothetical protein VGJ21_01870 [Terracidiphilus sp.]|jgi:hypothetical protein